MAASPAERYVRLCLELAQHDDGVVDAYFGPPELAAAVDAAPLPDPAALVEAADALLEELGDGWLRDQVVAVRARAGVLAGEAIAYADEVEACFGIRPPHTDEAVFAAAHEQLDELLSGDGPLADRYERWRTATLVPPDSVEPAVVAVIELARARTRELVDLPAGEDVEVALVHDEPWLAYNHYRGGLRSRIEVNADLPQSAIEVVRLAVHETYPGHHAERACKEHLLVRGRGLVEETVVVTPAPQSVVSEGIAVLAPELLLEGEGGPALVAAAGGAGLDLPHALAVGRAAEPLRWAEINAGLMLHDGAATTADVGAYLRRWTVMNPQVVDHIIRFLTEPASRTYMITYVAGRELCGPYAAGRPDRFRRLLTEQVRVGELLAASRG